MSRGWTMAAASAASTALSNTHVSKKHAPKKYALFILSACALLILCVVALASCSSTPAEIAADHELVMKFFLDHPDAKILSSASLAANEGSLAYQALLKSCGEGMPAGQYTRLIYISEKDAQQLAAYVFMPRKEVVCVRSGPEIAAEKSFSQDVLAYVDETAVTQQALAAYVQNINKNSDQNTTPTVALVSLITNTLLQREIDAKGIAISKQDVDALLQQSLQQLNLTQQQLVLSLDSAGRSFTDYENVLANQARINKLLQQEVISKVPSSVSEDELKNAYISNVNKLFVPAQARVRHIFFAADMTNATDSARALAKAQSVAQQLNATNFCEMAAAYSDDAGSSRNCGEVTFFSGQVLPEFETAVFAAQHNVPVLIRSTRGYHLTWVIETVQNQVSPYTSVRQTLANQLLASRAQQEYINYIQGLWKEHVILRQDLATLGNFSTQ